MAKKISVIIPNFNGKELLAKNLPDVIKNCPNCQIIVVDDGSDDESVEFLKKNFREIEVIESKKNEGFAKTVNLGAQKARGDYLLLLNTDVSTKPGFLQKALDHFEKNKTNKIFAVGLCDISHEKGKTVKRGKGSAEFIKGFIIHSAAPIKSGETFWVSGGSGLFDRCKFLELGGFDPAFAPFYWEDIDLSYRAQKSGLVCIFEPQSQVDHYHMQGSIRKNKSDFFIKTVSYKNQFLFVWKNIEDYFLILLHLLWQPYHFAKALLNLDLPFFVGFLWATVKIPSLIINSSLTRPERSRRITHHSSLSDREVLSKFDEQ